MSSCLSGGGRTYGFELEILKSTSTSSSIRTPRSSSPSSTISESSNSPITISTRKTRTPRKRPNQTYNEAAALLSTAYPNIFSTKHLTKQCKLTKPHDPFFNDSSELLLPFRVIEDPGCLIHQPLLEKPTFRMEHKTACQSPIQYSAVCCDGYQDEVFDAESILDEEIGEGIDSIMGNLSVTSSSTDDYDYIAQSYSHDDPKNAWDSGGTFECGNGMAGGVSAFRHVGDEGALWRFPTVDVLQISPKFNGSPVVEKKKKKKKIAKLMEESKPEPPKVALVPKLKMSESPSKDIPIPKPDSAPSLILKLNYDGVLNAWSDRGSPFSDDTPGSELPETDVSARLAEIDLFPAEAGGGVREASVLRYKEKRRTRLFSKKIRYQVRKVNADRRPRMKGRFVRRPNPNASKMRMELN